MKKLTELLALEKSGYYQEALDHIQAMTGDTRGVSPARSLNLKLLEQRLRARLQTSQPQAKSTTTKSAQQAPQNPKPATWSAIYLFLAANNGFAPAPEFSCRAHSSLT